MSDGNSPAEKPEVLASLQEEFTRLRPVGERIADCIKRELGLLVGNKGVTLGVPIETRVKDWASIKEKIERKALVMDSLRDLDDFVGVRIIVLFLGDLAKVKSCIVNDLDVVSGEDVGERLESSQFGYQSEHYTVRVPEKWLSIPSYSDLGGVKAEVQVRTMAQHIWAAASHKLQYKREESVPIPVRRAIHRASALLESVDLEFSRVLSERDRYLSDSDELGDNEPLDVDVLDRVLSGAFPPQNRAEIEPFDRLLAELKAFGIDTVGKLKAITQENAAAALAEDMKIVKAIRGRSELFENKKERTEKGVFFTHAGLLRQILIDHFGRSEFRRVCEEIGTWPKRRPPTVKKRKAQF